MTENSDTIQTRFFFFWDLYWLVLSSFVFLATSIMAWGPTLQLLPILVGACLVISVKLVFEPRDMPVSSSQNCLTLWLPHSPLFFFSVTCLEHGLIEFVDIGLELYVLLVSSVALVSFILGVFILRTKLKRVS